MVYLICYSTGIGLGSVRTSFAVFLDGLIEVFFLWTFLSVFVQSILFSLPCIIYCRQSLFGLFNVQMVHPSGGVFALQFLKLNA